MARGTMEIRRYGVDGMAILDIVLEGDPVLRKKAVKVPRADDGIRKLAANMYETMLEAPGVGLAAPQIGKSIRLIVVHVPEDEDDETPEVSLKLLNPEIIKAFGTQVGAEGCLSIPGWAGNVERAMNITVKATDMNDKPVRIRAQGYLAVVLQHEIDHLDGILFPDRIENTKEDLWPVRESEEELVEDEGIPVA
ncbi:MAG TPA: peptide deformylase [Thermomicrobiales bacterium]|nr:peptide deformylase [Thermomicrobiales bacterium]